MLHTITTVSIADKQFKQFHSLKLEQSLQGHHHFELKIGYDWLQELGPGIEKCSKLKTLFLQKCTSLVELHATLKKLSSLEQLNLEGCKKVNTEEPLAGIEIKHISVI